MVGHTDKPEIAESYFLRPSNVPDRQYLLRHIIVVMWCSNHRSAWSFYGCRNPCTGEFVLFGDSG